MFAGILGTWNLLPNIPQGVAVNDRSSACAVIVNVCNRGGSTASISIAISTSSTTPTAAEWIEWNTQLTPKNTLERQGILVPAGKYVIVRSNRADVNAVVYGVQNGDPITVTGITQNAGTAPTWVTSTTLPLFYAGNSLTNVQLEADDAELQSLSYTVTGGSLDGLSLSATGLISGTPSVVGYSSGLPDAESTVEITATDSSSNATPRTFNITKRWADGSTSGLAAPNASSIRNLVGATNGVYWINIPTVGPTQIYCDQVIDGGGWMMLGYAGSTAAAGNLNHIMFNQIGTLATTRTNDQTPFSRFDLARKFTYASSNSQAMWKRTTDTNVILIHSMDEMWNRIPGGSKAGDRDMNGGGTGFPITTMKMSNSGVGGIVSKSYGRYESGPAYPGIAWNSTYNDNTDGVGSFTTYLNRRSIIYWETNGPQSNNQWFHADPLQLGPSRGPTYGTGKKDIEVYFKV